MFISQILNSTEQDISILVYHSKHIIKAKAKIITKNKFK